MAHRRPAARRRDEGLEGSDADERATIENDEEWLRRGWAPGKPRLVTCDLASTHRRAETVALWRVVGRQRIEPKTLLDARLGSAIMNSMKSADTRESYVAENITCEIQIIYVVIVSRRFYQF